jgi:acid phosphatase
MNGQDLRQAYINSGFLSDTYNQSELHLRSDDEPRTVQSLQSLMLGLYPPEKRSDGLSEILDIHTRDITYDYMEPNDRLCPAYGKLVQEAMNSTQWVQRWTNITQPLISSAMANVTTTLSYSELNDCFNVHACNGFDIPINDDVYTKLQNEMNYYIYYEYTYPDVFTNARVGFGFYFMDVYNRIENVVNGVDQPIMFIDSGHDTSVMPFLAAYGVADGLWASYGIFTVLEMYRVATPTPSYAVRLIYRGEALTPPFCDDVLCDYDLFASYTQQLLPQNPSVDCFS